MKQTAAIIFFMFAICAVSGLHAQAYFVPKVGLSWPLTPPMIAQYEVDSRRGWLAGVELRSSRSPIYFNPGTVIYRNSIDLREFKGPADRDGSVIRQTQVTWIKVRIGVGAELIRMTDHSSLHLRGGLAPIFVLQRPSWDGLPILEENYRWGYFEYHLGVGFDLGRWVVDLDYQLSLVRNIHMSDIVENNLSLQFGFMIR